MFRFWLASAANISGLRRPRAVFTYGVSARLWDRCRAPGTRVGRGDLAMHRFPKFSATLPIRGALLGRRGSPAIDPQPGPAPASTRPGGDVASDGPRARETTWIEVQVVDERGVPVPDTRLRLELPGGAVREGVTDRDGLFAVDDIDPGSCTLVLPTHSSHTANRIRQGDEHA